MRSITSANAAYLLAITGLFPVPQQLQKFSADDVFSTDPIPASETAMGVDGFLAAGFVISEIPQTITLQADSESGDLFDAWYAQQRANRTIFRAQAVILLPALSLQWTMTNGVLKTYAPIPDAQKVLRPRKFTITWESANPAAAT